MRIPVAMALSLLTLQASAAEPSPDRQIALRRLLQSDCGACHGLSRKGGLGASLLPADLAGKSDAYLVEIIQNGQEGTAMPPWNEFLTQQETYWLVQKLLRTGP